MIDSILQLVAPVSCVACGAKARLFCESHLGQGPAVTYELAGLKGYYITQLSPEIHAAISAYKDRSVTALAKDLALIAERLTETSAWAEADCIVYPPSTPKAFRKRGFSPTGLILKKIRHGVPTVELRLAKRVTDQRSLRAEQRIQNLAGAYRSPGLVGKKVLLFDDVSTTGATLREMQRAVEVSGAQVTGFCVLARSIFETEAE